MTYYSEVDFKHEINLLREPYNYYKMHEIVHQTNLGLTKKTLTFEKHNKCGDGRNLLLKYNIIDYVYMYIYYMNYVFT